MKKWISLILALILACSMIPAVGADAPSQVTIGTLALLNTDEVNVVNYYKAQMLVNMYFVKTGLVKLDVPAGEIPEEAEAPEIVVRFYDNLDSMLMGLQAGDIDMMCIYETTADYICANNDQVVKMPENPDYARMDDTENPGEFTFTGILLKGIMSNDFAFMMMENNTALRDEFNQAIRDILADKDGLMAKLVTEQIDGAISGAEITPVEMPHFEGAETIKVAVTGCLPPMDYTHPDGSPAGFNTAFLAEISKRLQKNIELQVVSSLGRSTALAGGTVDAVFWTRTGTHSNWVASADEEAKGARLASILGSFTDEEREFFTKIDGMIDFETIGNQDMPEGTIITDAYFNDSLTMVMTKDAVEALKASNGE